MVRIGAGCCVVASRIGSSRVGFFRIVCPHQSRPLNAPAPLTTHPMRTSRAVRQRQQVGRRGCYISSVLRLGEISVLGCAKRKVRPGRIHSPWTWHAPGSPMGGTTEVSLDGRRGGVVAGVALPGAHHCEPEWLLPPDGQRGGGAELDTRRSSSSRCWM